MIFQLHVTLSISSPDLSRILFMSCWHASSILFPVVLSSFPLCISVLNALFCGRSSSLLITCLYQINLLYGIFLEASATLVVHRMCSFLDLSFRVTPHIIALPCRAFVDPLDPRGAVGARNDGILRQFSPLLPVVSQGFCICEEFTGPPHDVLSPPLQSQYQRAAKQINRLLR